MNTTDPGDGVLGCSEPACYGLNGWIADLELEAGRTYIIAVGSQESFFPPSGAGTLTIGRQDGACSRAIEASEGVNAFDMPADETAYIDLRATEFAESSAMQQIFNARFFKFTPKETTRYTVSTCGRMDFDSELAILQGCSVEDGVVAANSEGACIAQAGTFIVTTTLASLIGVELEAGVEYSIVVGGRLQSSRGPGSIEITRFEPCPLDIPNAFDDEACGASDPDDETAIRSRRAA
jgi:hypothetical protein